MVVNRLFSLILFVSIVGCSSNKNLTKPQFYSKLPPEEYNKIIGKTPKNAEYSIAPIIERKFPPKYPPEALKQKLSGKVILSVEVLKNGQVGMIQVSESSGYHILDDAAKEAVKTWRFTPAMKDKQAVSVWVNFPVEFTIK
jgi:TonB family protein